MSQLEPIQFQVGLTKNPDVLKQLKKNKLFREDESGPYLALQFDAQEFKFRPGQTFTVGKTVGNALIRSSAVLVGTDPLSDPYFPYVEKLSESQLGVVDKKRKSQFACPICGEDMKNGPKLARHLMDKKAHVEDDERAAEEFEAINEGDADEATDVVEIETEE
jgi:hypothetical protein